MLRFPVDRIIAGQHRGEYTEENTALACPYCNGKKGPNIASVVPGTQGPPVALFNPRTERWADHFAFEGARVVGLTSTGEATASLLAMNAEERLELRSARGYGA
ncbi:hypothetical protein Pla123a_48470 [Posidoniimonas polymericola]|uniref:HNH domain-containing protein n=2 Tax=Posidoniimonas polymericola TaxID=2528002 RepID=A0A5C5XRR5_9BACT|nr:hypothetical protein Pla123a_48470 [Posidoniimonas polymericola]